MYQREYSILHQQKAKRHFGSDQKQIIYHGVFNTTRPGTASANSLSFIRFGTKLYKQIVGILMGTNYDCVLCFPG